MVNIMQSMKLQYIEWHDAKLGKIELRPGGDLLLCFEHICSYHQPDTGNTEVWSSKAEIILKQVSFFSIDNVFLDTYLDGSLLDAEGKEVSLLPIGSEKPVSEFNLFLAGVGTNIIIKAKSAQIESLQAIEKLEEIE